MFLALACTPAPRRNTTRFGYVETRERGSPGMRARATANLISTGTKDVKLRSTLTAATLAAGLFASLAAAAGAVTFDQNSQVSGTLQNDLSSQTSKDGDTFTLVTDSAPTADGQVVHATIYGHVSEVVKSGLTQKAHIKLNFDRVALADGSSAPIDAKLVSMQAKQKTNAVKAIGAVVVGDLLGNYIGKHMDSNIGGIIGAGTGILYAATMASDVVVQQGSTVTLQLNQPVTIRPQATH
jgi:hypothetical protein